MNGPNEENNLDQLTCTVYSFRSCEPFCSPALELTCNTSTACICFPRCIKEPLHFRRYSDHSSDDGPHGPDGSAMPNMQKPFHTVWKILVKVYRETKVPRNDFNVRKAASKLHLAGEGKPHNHKAREEPEDLHPSPFKVRRY